MEVVKEFARMRYDWPKLTDGKIRRARPGRDYTCSAYGFRMGLHKHAARHHLKVRTLTGADATGPYIEFQFSRIRRPRKRSSK